MHDDSAPEAESKGVAKPKVGQDESPILAQAEAEPEILPPSDADIASEVKSDDASELDKSKPNDDADSDKQGV